MSELGLIAQESSEAVMAANHRLDTSFLQAMNRKDVDGVMACLLDSPELVLVLYGNIYRGPEAVRTTLNDLFSNNRSVRLEINDVRHWMLGETVFAVGIATYEFESLDGARSTLKECWTDARQRSGGKWVYVLDHAALIP